MLQENQFKYTSDIKGYQNAVWDFLLEHSSITPEGTIFIKFHTKDQKNFNNRVLGRWKYNYHREDLQAKKKLQDRKRKEYLLLKKLKKEKYKKAKKERILLLAKK